VVGLLTFATKTLYAHVYYKLCLPHILSFHHFNTVLWRVQIIKLLIMQFSPAHLNTTHIWHSCCGFSVWWKEMCRITRSDEVNKRMGILLDIRRFSLDDADVSSSPCLIDIVAYLLKAQFMKPSKICCYTLTSTHVVTSLNIWQKWN
jgi:hypothetical protein